MPTWLNAVVFMEKTFYGTFTLLVVVEMHCIRTLMQVEHKLLLFHSSINIFNGFMDINDIC